MAELSLVCTGMAGEFPRLTDERLRAAAAALESVRDFRSIEICADDTGERDALWLHFGDADADDERPAVTVYCSIEAFRRRGPAAGLFPAVEIWEQAAPKEESAPGSPADFDEAGADRFLHHALLQAADLAGGAIDREDVPDGLIEAFGAAWSVTVDGRLARLGLPGYDLGHRRGRFSELFSAAGVLLPGHWEIFQALWDGGIAGCAQVLDAVRQLPRL